MSSLQSSIFREASQSSSLGISVRNYSLTASDDSPTGIETWLSPETTAATATTTTATGDKHEAPFPEIMWEDSSHMKVFRFRSGRSSDKSRSAPLKSSMSAAQYRRQGAPSQASTKSPSSAVSLELASAWLQMGEMRQQRSEGAAGSTSTESSHSSSSCTHQQTSSRSTSHDSRRAWNESRQCDAAPTTKQTSYKDHAISSKTKQPCVVNTGARPRWRSSSRSVAAAAGSASRTSGTHVGGRAKKRDSAESRVSVKDDRPSHSNESTNTTKTRSQTRQRHQQQQAAYARIFAHPSCTSQTTANRVCENPRVEIGRAHV